MRQAVSLAANLEEPPLTKHEDWIADGQATRGISRLFSRREINLSIRTFWKSLFLCDAICAHRFGVMEGSDHGCVLVWTNFALWIWRARQGLDPGVLFSFSSAALPKPK